MKVKMRVPNSLDYDSDAISLLTGVDVSIDPETGEELPSLTQQQFKDECDINTIVSRFGITGVLPEVRMPVSGDFTGVSDFHAAMNLVRDAQEQFALVDPVLRQRFNNDPGELIRFVENAENRDEAIELGLIPRPPEKTRDVVQAVDELAAKMNVTPKA